MRSNLDHNKAHEVDFHTQLFACDRRTLADDLTLIHDSTVGQFLDPDGEDRIVTLPSFRRGRYYLVANIGTEGVLFVEDHVGNSVLSIYPGEMHAVLCSGQEWQGTPDVFTGSGADASSGLVPPPPTVAGNEKFLREDGVWADPGFVGDDAFTNITDGTNTAVAAGADTFKLRSANGILTVVVTNNDVTHGDNALFTVVEGSINHDALSGFVANEHIDHSAVSINTAANSGLAGGGTIAASRSLSLDINNLSSIASPALADSIALYDADGVVTGKALLSAINAILDHDALVNFVANEHIDHTTVSIAGGTGLQGGGTIAANRTISLDLNSLSTASPALTDNIVFFAGSDHEKATLAVVNGLLVHDDLAGFVANEHIDHTSVSITTAANSGLSGGGTIAATRSLVVDIASLTEITSLDDAADFFMVLDATDSTLKKVKPENLPAGSGVGDIFARKHLGIAPNVGLVVKTVSNSTIDIDATEIVLFDSGGDAKRLTGLNETLDITASGANGLDTGAEGSSRFYHVWAIAKSDGTLDGLLSESATAPTLPATYTFQAYLGAVYNDGSSNFVSTHQVGNRTSILASSNNAIANGSATTWTAVSLTAIVPPNAVEVYGYWGVVQSSASSASIGAAMAGDGTGGGTATAIGEIFTQNPYGNSTNAQIATFMLELTVAQSLDYYVYGTNSRINITVNGWRYG